jgi:hypothetical protein
MAVKTFSLDIAYAAASLKAVWTNTSGEYWNAQSSTYEAYDSANWNTSEYLVSVTANGKTGEFKTTVPALPGSASSPAVHKLTIYYLPSGSASTANDYPVLESLFVWNATVEVTLASGGQIATAGDLLSLNGSDPAELVQAAAEEGLRTYNLDHLVASAVDTNFATTVHLNSVIGHLADNGTSATFDRTTDALEELAGGGGTTAQEVWEYGSRTLTSGRPDHSVISPASPQHLDIYRADAYASAQGSGRKLTFTEAANETHWPDTITTVHLTIQPTAEAIADGAATSSQKLDDVAGVVTSNSIVYFELPGTSTDDLASGVNIYRFWVVANKATSRATLRSGTCTVRPNPS